MQWNDGIIGYADRAAFIACLVSLVAGLSGLVIPPLRGFCGLVLYVASFLIGLDVWLISLITVHALWGTFAVIVGLFLAGVGVAPMALVALALHREWLDVGLLLLNFVIVFGCRAAGLALTKSAERRSQRKFA